MNDTYDLLALGELLIDFTPTGETETYVANPGGAPGNMAATAARYGLNAAFIGAVGSDHFGRLLLDSLEGADVETKLIQVTEEAFTTLAFVSLQPDGEREFSFARKPGADSTLALTDELLEAVGRTTLLHFGTISLISEPARSTTRSLVLEAEKQGRLVSFDPNLRESLWDTLEHAREEILWGIEHCDILKLGEAEYDFLTDKSRREFADELFEKTRIQLLVVTLGEQGCRYYTRQVSCHTPGLQMSGTVDTTGAGDIFTGSLVSQLLKKARTPDEIASLDDQSLCEMMAWASAAAGLSTTRYGGIPSIPDEAEVEEILS